MNTYLTLTMYALMASSALATWGDVNDSLNRVLQDGYDEDNIHFFTCLKKIPRSSGCNNTLEVSCYNYIKHWYIQQFQHFHQLLQAVVWADIDAMCKLNAVRNFAEQNHQNLDSIIAELCERVSRQTHTIYSKSQWVRCRSLFSFSSHKIYYQQLIIIIMVQY